MKVLAYFDRHCPKCKAFTEHRTLECQTTSGQTYTVHVCNVCCPEHKAPLKAA